eukprot:c28226_g1_i3 orf=384-2126(-)
MPEEQSVQMDQVESAETDLTVVPPNERIQMQRIRELDLEQLEVEEVDSDTETHQTDDSSFEGLGDGGAGPHGGFTFDTSLACLHSYLGEVDDITCRRSFLEGGAILTLPMFYLEGIVLFPEATLPLRVLQPRFKAAVELAVRQEDAPYTIGVIHVRARPRDTGLHFALVGTTAEIRQLRHLQDGSINVVTRGRQRFRICHAYTNAAGAPLAQVQIIPEDTPLHIPRDAFGVLASVPHIQSGKVPRGISKSADPHIESEEELEGYFSDSTQDEEPLLEMSINRLASVADELLHSAEDTNEENSSEDETRHRWWWRRRANRRISVGHTRQEQRNLRPSEVSRDDSVADDHSESMEAISGSSSLGKRRKIDGGWGGACKAWAADEAKWMRRAQCSAWPHWVYRMYDAYDLARRAADMWRQMVELPSIDDLVNKPELLSYHIASKIPVQDATRQELLEIDGIVYRLQREIQLLECMDQIRCKNCLTEIARRSDMLVMSADGPIGAYVNKYGYVHETLTLCRARGLILQGRPDTQHSWFPGYAWTIADCSVCESHMGWLFTAVTKNMRPKAFWGMRRSQLAENAS